MLMLAINSFFTHFMLCLDAADFDVVLVVGVARVVEEVVVVPRREGCGPPPGFKGLGFGV